MLIIIITNYINNDIYSTKIRKQCCVLNRVILRTIFLTTICLEERLSVTRDTVRVSFTVDVSSSLNMRREACYNSEQVEHKVYGVR